MADINNNGIPDEVEAANIQIANDKALADANKAAGRAEASTLLTKWLSTFFDPAKDMSTITDLATFIDQQIQAGSPADAIKIDLRSTNAYKTRFSGNAARVASGLSEYTPAEYLQAEESYNDILKRGGLDKLATRNNFASLIGGQVSAVELQDRIVNVYNNITNADSGLQTELKRLSSTVGITNQDLAESLLMGKEGAASLKSKIAQAEIRTEAATQGLTSTLGDVELQRLGVTRDQARAGFANVKSQKDILNKLSGIYRQPGNAGDIQSELEKEQFTGLESQRRKSLAKQEVASYSKQIGTASLGSSTTGLV
jgi:hypothetical protein